MPRGRNDALHASELHRQAPRTASAGAFAATLRPAIFLHTGWRSGGTWLWSRCRAQASARGLYEPLHEQLSRLRRAELAKFRPDSWASNHSDTAPYFQEYDRVLPKGGRGVPLYRQRFAFDNFFMAEDEPDDALEAYLDALLASAEPGQVSVLKFCRSLGRVGWMERRFPQALHAVVLRDPISQWTSAQRLLAVQRNRYFSLAPIMVLARNARHRLVRQTTSALGVTLPELFSDDLAYAAETCWRHFGRLDAAARYRQFLAFWTASALRALRSEAMVIDAVRMAADPSHRQAIEAALGARLGQDPDLGASPAAVPAAKRPVPVLGAIELDEAHAAASALVRAHGATLSLERQSIALALLGAGRSEGFRQRVWGRTPIAPSAAEEKPPIARRSAPRRLVTTLMVASARALQPLRRLHGRLTIK